jgi:hypothetical protein
MFSCDERLWLYVGIYIYWCLMTGSTMMMMILKL